MSADARPSWRLYLYAVICLGAITGSLISIGYEHWREGCWFLLASLCSYDLVPSYQGQPPRAP